MSKFKIGDKVRILDVDKIAEAVNNGYSTGEITLVVRVNSYGEPYILNKRNPEGHPLVIVSDELRYIKKVCEPSENQRITALEKEIAELRYFKELAQEMEDNSFHDLERIEALENRLEHLEQAVQQYFTVPGEPSTVKDKPKTPNQQRKEIIEKAKLFIEKHGEGFLFDSAKNSICAAKLEKFQDDVGYGACIGYSRCHRNDVFNEHIGKAIALGRALRLNVREFEQVVQPTEKVVGMKVLYVDEEDFVVELKPSSFASLYSYKLGTAEIGSYVSEHSTIIDDTNAIYGGDE